MIPVWSHTMLSDFGNCMWKGYRKYIARDLPREEKSHEQLQGVRVHQAYEQAINSPHEPRGHEVVDALVKPLIAANARAEYKLGVDRDGHGAEFFGAPWGRGVIDVLVRNGDTAFLCDWKTGKVREDNRELLAQSYLLQANFPEIKRVSGAYVWLVEKRIGQLYDLTDTSRWLAGTRALLAKCEEAEDSGHWPKSPNGLCGWCPVKDCEHNRS